VTSPELTRAATSTGASAVIPVPATPYQRDIARYWDGEARPVNLRLGDVDGLYHHHYGDVDHAALGDAGDSAYEKKLIAELHRLESAQAELLLDHLGSIGHDATLVDAGCGRGGSMVMAHQRFGCTVEGVTLSAGQADFANRRARELGIEEHVRARVCNMLDMPFETGQAAGSWNNESSMYVDLHDLFAEHSRILAIGGRYVTITGCWNPRYGQPSKWVSQINAHFECNIHSRREYLRAMADNRLVPHAIIDLTPTTLPYWELRATSSLRFSQRRSFPDSVEDECGPGYVADPAGTERDPLERAPAFLEFGGSALAEGAQVPDQGIRGAGFGVEGLFGLALGAADRDVDTDACADVALVGEGRQTAGGGLVQGGQDVDAGGGDVGCGAGLDVGDPQRGAVRGGQELHVAAECLVFLAEPQVVAVVPDACEAVGFDECAVEDHVRHALLPAAVEDVVQVGGLVGQDIDAFVEVAVAGGLGDAGVAGQAVHAATLAEPAQNQHGLTERTERTRPPRGAQPPPVGGQQS
jgi:geranyl diphosphate 2-C-methyltransferase